jgi:hypothetical protein
MAMAMGEWTCSTLLMRLPALQTTYVRTSGRASAVRKKQRFSTTTTAAITSSAFFVSLSFSSRGSATDGITVRIIACLRQYCSLSIAWL